MSRATTQEAHMAYFTHTVNPIGAFVEKDTGNTFEFSHNDDPYNGFNEDFPHKIWVGGLVNDQGYRYGNVMKTRVVICVDEDEFGLPVTEKWYIKKHREYAV
jgi:hypothetical protein